jgi:hypothetical protein
MACCILNFNGYWNCGSVGRSFWVATYARTGYFHFVETKPIILNFLDVMRNQFIRMLLRSVAFSGLFTYVASYSIYVFKVDAKTYGWIFCLYVFEFYQCQSVELVVTEKI